MNEIVYVKDVLPEIAGICGFAIVVVLGFLVYEIKWRREHPKGYTPEASAEEKKSCRQRASRFFCFMFVWILAFMAYLLARSGTINWAAFSLVGAVCLGGILLSLNIRR